ncbi:hypothetical protein RvY_16314 [Ramazzottius varieornatus]|uniref:M-phase inducer phosphatase n=1 Tax=Ramazzottius varieornatus TaxID=947166 RepID=A0A1D1VY08_RAMVA|nr:hypothetical protein RvY_16314 [Ramazzottius varieornatus]
MALRDSMSYRQNVENTIEIYEDEDILGMAPNKLSFDSDDQLSFSDEDSPKVHLASKANSDEVVKLVQKKMKIVSPIPSSSSNKRLVQLPLTPEYILNGRGPVRPGKRLPLSNNNSGESGSSTSKKLKTFDDRSSNQLTIQTTLFSQQTLPVRKRTEISDPDKKLVLPTVTDSNNRELNCITPETLRSAILREAPFENLSSLEVIDCRYPYEYDGGHIRTAINCHTQEELREKFAFKEKEEDFGKKKAIVFHCEFSSKRAPEMYRFLRNADRHHNVKSYPKLSYPEIYLLSGGYKTFFERFPEMCDPSFYKPMVADGHENDLVAHKKKAKDASVKCAAKGKAPKRAVTRR